MSDLDRVSELDAMLRKAAGDAAHRAVPPPYEDVQAGARRRRTVQATTAGAFGVVLSLVVGVAAVAGTHGGERSDRPQPAASSVASSVALDPALRPYVTTIPVLAWGPVAGRTAKSVTDGMTFLSAVFAGVPGEHDFSYWSDLRKTFPDAPIGGNAVVLDQSFTRAEIEAAAANVRKLDGVKYARVVDVKGLWFTLWARAAYTPPSQGANPSGPPVGYPDAPSPIDLHEFQIVGGRATGGDDHELFARATFVGPSLSLADFNLMRRRAAEALDIDVSQVVVKAESAGPAVTATK